MNLNKIEFFYFINDLTNYNINKLIMNSEVQNFSNSNELNSQISYYLRNINNGGTSGRISRFIRALPFLELNTSGNEEINNDDGNNNDDDNNDDGNISDNKEVNLNENNNIIEEGNIDEKSFEEENNVVHDEKCPICMEVKKLENKFECKHSICIECFRGQLKSKVNLVCCLCRSEVNKEKLCKYEKNFFDNREDDETIRLLDFFSLGNVVLGAENNGPVSIVPSTRTGTMTIEDGRVASISWD